MIPSRDKLAELFAEMQRVEKSRSEYAEVRIQRVYKAMLKELREFLGSEYAKYAEDDVLSYSTLIRNSRYARFIEEVQKKVNARFLESSEIITALVTDTYGIAYAGMVHAVSSAINNETLATLLGGLELTRPEVIKAAVNNPISKLTLPRTLEKNRKQIIHRIKTTITNGLLNGDRMSTMAERIKKDVDISYRKSILIARTETHRVRETGHNDASADIDKVLQEEGSSYRMVKKWRTMRDEVVRHTAKADHRKMHGVIVPQDADFDLGRGVFAPCPGQSGTPYNDCNCRCYVSHDFMSDEELFRATGKHFADFAT